MTHFFCNNLLLFCHLFIIIYFDLSVTVFAITFILNNTSIDTENFKEMTNVFIHFQKVE